MGEHLGNHLELRPIFPIPNQPILRSPFAITATPLYTAASVNVEVYIPEKAPLGVTPIGSGFDNIHFPLIAQNKDGNCTLLWGYSDRPSLMTLNGKFLFLNALGEHGCLPRVAYISAADTATRDGFRNLFIGNNVEVDTVDISAADTFDFRGEDTIILGPDTGSMVPVPAWLGSQAAKDNLLQSRRPILGIFEGGGLFFDLIGLKIGRYSRAGYFLGSRQLP